VDNLFERGLASDRFTIAIDDTIGTRDADEIRDFLRHNQSRIESGRLNVVIYRSAVKFDILGMDSCNAGVMLAINSPVKWTTFNREVAMNANQISNTVLQWILHYQNYAQDELNERTRAIMDVAKRMSSPAGPDNPLGFPPEMIGISGNESPIQIAPSSDPQIPFLDIDFNSVADSLGGQLLRDCLLPWIEQDPTTPIEWRPSFGFNGTNLATVVLPDTPPADASRKRTKIRLSIGLEGDEMLAHYRDLIVLWNQILCRPAIDYPNDLQLQRAMAEQVVNASEDPLSSLQLASNFLRVGLDPRLALFYRNRAIGSLENHTEITDAWRDALCKNAERIESQSLEHARRAKQPIHSFRIVTYAANESGPVKLRGRS
jgi:hypothetical protein